jgi:hypothetical protein
MIKPLLYFGLSAAVIIWLAALICIFAGDNNWEDEMDDIDRACEREQMDRELAIAAAAQHEPMLPACGECYNCGSSVFLALASAIKIVRTTILRARVRKCDGARRE